MMGERQVQVTDGIGNWVNGALPGYVDLVGNTRMEKMKIYSSPFNSNNMQNTRERLNEEIARRLAFTNGVSQSLKPIESSGWTAGTAFETSNGTPFLQTMWPIGSANIFRGSFGQISEKMMVSQQQEYYLHQSIKVPESSAFQEWTCANQRRNLHNGLNIQQIPPQNFQRALQPMQLKKYMGAQQEGVSSWESTQSYPQRAGYLHSPHGVVVDQSTNKKQPIITFCGCPSGVKSSKIQAYRKLLQLRETYLGESIKRYNSAQRMYQKALNAEDIQKFEKLGTLLHKLVMFLQMSTADFLKYPEEVFDAELKAFELYIKKIRSLYRPTQHHQGVQQPHSLLTPHHVLHTGDENSQVNPTRQHSTSTHDREGHLFTKQGPSTGIQRGDSSVNNLMRSELRSTIVRPQQANMSIPHQIGSQSELQQRVSSSRSHLSLTNMLQNPLQVNSSAMDMENATGSTMSSPPSNTTAGSCQSFIKQERRKQSLQQASVYEHMQKRLAKKSSEMNELKLQKMTSNHQTLQPNHLVGQHIEHFTSEPGPSSASHRHASPPSNSTAGSCQSFMKQERRKRSLQQGSVYEHTQKRLAKKSSEMNELKFQKMTSNQQMLQPNQLVGQCIEHFTSEPGPSNASQQHASPMVSEQPLTSIDTRDSFSLHRETHLLESSQKSHLEEQGFKCLIEKSTSPKALCASVRDIGELIQKEDRIPEILANTEPWDLNVQDWEYGMRPSALESNLNSFSGAPPEKRMKRDVALSLDVLPSPSSGSNGFPCLSGQVCGTGTSATFYTKENFAWCDLLSQEIKKINEKLIETVLEVIDENTDARVRSGEGTIVKFSYRAISDNSINLPLQVLVTADYPYSSLLILDAAPEKKEMKELWDKAKSKFSSSLRICSKPSSLSEMAKCWDISARQAFCEFAEKSGGGSLFSKYGSWEHCAAS